MTSVLEEAVAVQGAPRPADAQAVLGAIRTRRSVGRPMMDPVPIALIEHLLDAAVQAPNHRLTAPWRFCVVTGAALTELGRASSNAVRRALHQKGEDPDGEPGRRRVAYEVERLLRGPVLIAVLCKPSAAAGVVVQEEYLACAAAVQNILLAAHSLGLAACWRTADRSRYPEVREWFGLSGRDEVIGLVYVGWPDPDRPTKPLARRRWSEFTEWRGLNSGGVEE
jgi:nitroreductase